jgi:hypothetical protein
MVGNRAFERSRVSRRTGRCTCWPMLATDLDAIFTRGFACWVSATRFTSPSSVSVRGVAFEIDAGLCSGPDAGASNLQARLPRSHRPQTGFDSSHLTCRFRQVRLAISARDFRPGYRTSRTSLACCQQAIRRSRPWMERGAWLTSSCSSMGLD